ncbi:MAG: hypothetical protein NVS9B4_13340 [Candidatus Acidiferrum sp.]
MKSDSPSQDRSAIKLFQGAKRFSHLLTLLSLLLYPAFANAQAGTQTLPSGGSIRVNVDRVNIGVSVTDANGNFVKGLGQRDFRVFDNGVEQPITGFLSNEEPAQVVLMMESGPAAFFLQKSEVQAANMLVSAFGPRDRVAIVSYSRNPVLNLNFTQDKSQIKEVIDGLSFMQGYAELNLASSIAATINWLATMPGKKTLVLLSSGVDTSELPNWQLVEQKINTSDVRILAVSLAGDIRTPVKRKKLSAKERESLENVRKVAAEADESLRRLSQATGGRAYFPKTAKDLENTYAEIAQLVQHEYGIEFAPVALDGRLHIIKVEMKRPELRVEHRQAYLAISPS